jgi:subtilisin family serine protease
MNENRKVITLIKGANKDEFLNNLKRDTTNDSSVDSSIIPDRIVEIVRPNLSSPRILQVSLTDEEAAEISDHPEVVGVELPLEWLDEWLDVEESPFGGTWVRESPSTYNISTANPTRTNWGLSRHTKTTNQWGVNVVDDLPAGTTYDYHLDGTGIDYIHQEGGFIRTDHEQFLDKDGNSRVVEFQWNTLPNHSHLPTMDYSAFANNDGGLVSSNAWGHATHCAGTAVGKDVGWAKGAAIYTMPIDLMNPGNGNEADWFSAIKEFHLAKPIDPVTGFKRPTVVSASWGIKGFFSSISDIQFRGSSVGSGKSRTYGMIGDTANRFNTSAWSLNAAVEDMQSVGVHYFKSAGNQKQKLCHPGDIDFDNHIIRLSATGHIPAGSPVYYNRGAGNIGPDTVVVGNIDSALYDDNGTDKEVNAGSSDKGPRVDIWAAGSDIVSSYRSSSSTYNSITGTSMATPQIAGMSCLLLQLNPGWTPAQLREWWHTNSIKDLLYQGPTDESDTYTFWQSDIGLQNSENRIAYFPYSGHVAMTITSDV